MAHIPPDDAQGSAQRDPAHRARLAELRRLEALVYGPPTGAPPPPDAAERLAALRVEHDARRAAARDSAAAAQHRADRDLVRPGHAGDAAEPAEPRSEPDGTPADHGPPVPPPWWARRPVLVLGAAAVLIGALIGSAVTMAGAFLSSGGALAGPAATAGPSGDPATGSTVDSPAALRIFDREQVPSDLPPVLDTVRLRQTTFRPLGPTGTGWLYAARDVDDGVCLVLVTPTGSYTASCVPQNRFPADGILLRASIESSDPADDGFTDLEVRWLPDGSVTGERTSR